MIRSREVQDAFRHINRSQKAEIGRYSITTDYGKGAYYIER